MQLLHATVLVPRYEVFPPLIKSVQGSRPDVKNRTYASFSHGNYKPKHCYPPQLEDHICSGSSMRNYSTIVV